MRAPMNCLGINITVWGLDQSELDYNVLNKDHELDNSMFKEPEMINKPEPRVLTQVNMGRSIPKPETLRT